MQHIWRAWHVDCPIVECLLFSQRAKRGYFIPLYWLCKIHFAFHDHPTHIKMEFFNELDIQSFKEQYLTCMINTPNNTHHRFSFSFCKFINCGSKAFSSFWWLLFILNLWAFLNGSDSMRVLFPPIRLIAWLMSIVCLSFYCIHSLTKQKPSNSIPGNGSKICARIICEKKILKFCCLRSQNCRIENDKIIFFF